jgi:cellulose synthase/poly-beta-1,6-N-acetylglucosamine synthase-like glycosyltransferase
MKQSLSIAVPAYEAHGKGWLYISELLNSIKKQTFQDYEVVISDQSTDDKVKKICEVYSEHMNIKYVSGHFVERTNSCNANNAINNCSYDNIKIIFQDDFFYDENALKYISDSFEQGANWILSGCLHCKNIHTLERPFFPKYNDNIHLGLNTISSPSVLAFKGKNLFDEKLIMLMDCDIYKRLYNTYGNPVIINKLLVVNRMHENQMQNTHAHLLEQEKQYCEKKFKER